LLLFLGLTLVWLLALVFRVKFGWGLGVGLGRTIGLLGIAAELGLLLAGLLLLGPGPSGEPDWLEDPAPPSAKQLEPQTAPQLTPQISAKTIVIDDGGGEPDGPRLPAGDHGGG
jgi:hypothetical protein